MSDRENLRRKLKEKIHAKSLFRASKDKRDEVVDEVLGKFGINNSKEFIKNMKNIDMEKLRKELSSKMSLEEKDDTL